MADNVRIQIKAAIKRASASARSHANKLDRAALDDLTSLYQEAAALIRDQIEAAADSSGLLRLESMADLLSQVENQLNVMSAARNTLLTAKMSETALLASNVFSSDIARVGSSLNQIANDAVLQARHFIDQDGLQLSDRLWRLDNNAKKAVGDMIQVSIIQGHSAANAAQEFVSSGRTVPADITDKINQANATKVGRNAASALLRDQGNAYAHSLRVFRTEINRAHNNAYEASAMAHPDAVGTRFLLSPNHPQIDICDMHAHANLYGLGPGVYPFGKNPLPAHPNTLSYKEIVFADEVSEMDKSEKVDRITWLKAQAQGRQNQILGQGKGWMLRAGLLTPNAISTPWAALKARLEKQGVEIPRFTIEKPIIPVAQPSTEKAPVSLAFDLLGYREQAKHTLSVIDKVHSDGVLPKIPIKRTRARGYAGQYKRYTIQSGDDAVDISISSLYGSPEFTLTHEIGHFIDHKGLPGPGMSSESHPMMDKWRKAVMNSPEIKWLRQLHNGPARVVVDGQVVSVDRQHIEYLLRPREIWARAYSQWVATKSGDKLLLGQLNTIMNNDSDQAIPFGSQWRDKHFTPIAEAIESLFNEMGWLDE